MLRLFRTSKARRRELLSAYLDGRLTPSDQAEAERLLARSEDARRELESLRATVALLRQAPAVEPRRSFTLTPEMAARTSRAQGQAAGWLRWGPYATAAAALFLAFALAGGATDLFEHEAAMPEQGVAARDALQAPPSATLAAPAPQAPPLPFRAAGTPEPTGTPPAPGIAAAAGPAGERGPAGPAGPAGPQGATGQQDNALMPGQSLAPEAGALSQDKAIAPVPAAEDGRSFPWLALQAAAGALTGVAIAATLWQYRRRRRQA
jgi:hypothetical protein